MWSRKVMINSKENNNKPELIYGTGEKNLYRIILNQPLIGFNYDK